MLQTPLEEDVLDESLEGEVGDPEVGADDNAGNDDDRDPLHELWLLRPFDLLQLGDRFSDEAAKAGAGNPALGLDGRRCGALDGRALSLLRTVGAVPRLALLLRAAGASLCSSLPWHR
jgi:hypothetical protein